MPGAGEIRLLRRRIRSVKSTQKITRAMELIAASRITRARNAVEAARPYAEMLTRVMADLATESEVTGHPLFAPHEQLRRVGVVVITSDRGLAGAYNTNVLRRTDRLIAQERQAGREVAIYAVGRKAESYLRYRGERLEQVWSGISDRPDYASAQEVSARIMRDYGRQDINRVWMAYTNFKSAMTQVSSTVQVLPVDPAAVAGGHAFPPQFVFEPDPETLLSQLIPKYVEQRLFAGLLESAASEHASRQRAMKAATDNAGDIIEDLTREANRARQAAITTEISEIVGGAEALGSDS